MFEYYGSSDDLAKFVTKEPEIYNMMLSVIKEWIDPILTNENLRTHIESLVGGQGVDENAAYETALNDLREVGRGSAAHVHGLMDALIKGRTIPHKYHDTAHAIVSAYLYFKIVKLREQSTYQG